MGQVFIDFTIRNSYDVDRADDGRLLGSAVRATSLKQVVMDSGATHLCLPADVVATLGLRLNREVAVETPTGVSIARVFRLALVTFEDREAFVEAVELPAGRAPLLGAIPMEILGIEPDLRNRRVRKLPLDTQSSFMRM